MHEKVDSGAVRGYTPAPQAQQYPQQPFQAQQYPQQYQPQPFQSGQCQQPLQQYQQVQPVQPPQQYYQQAANTVVYERYATAEQITEKQPVQRKGGGLAGFFKRRDVVVLICAIFSMVWLLIVHTAVGDALNAAPTGDTWEELGAAMGTAIGAAMMIPFFIVAFIGQIFNWVAWLTNRKGFILTAAILYCVSLPFGFFNGLGMIVCIVLGFIGYARLKKQQ